MPYPISTDTLKAVCVRVSASYARLFSGGAYKLKSAGYGLVPYLS